MPGERSLAIRIYLSHILTEGRFNLTFARSDVHPPGQALSAAEPQPPR